MATIVTVHGTNASGPRDADEIGGGHWWQRNSYFSNHMQELLEAESGDIEIEPLIWDGSNSEVVRSGSGESLSSLLKTLEQKQQPYCVIGHSHGGSVISHAIMNSAHKKPANWKQWITIGTPFVHLEKHFLLFSRLNTPARAAYMIIFLYIIAAIMIPFYLLKEIDVSAKMGVGIFLLVTALVSYLLVSNLQPRKLKQHNQTRMRRARENFKGSWVSLWHEDDEALQGLKHLHRVKLRPFGARFAAGAITFFAIFILPLLLFVISQNESATNWLIEVTQSDFQNLNSLARDGTVLERFVSIFVIVLFYPLKALHNSIGFQLPPIADLIVGGVLGLASMWLVALIIYLPFRSFSEFVSRIISESLNKATQKQVNKSALGSDAIGESALYAREYPAWMTETRPPLPRTLSDEITAMSDRAAAESIAEIREALNKIAFSESHEDANDLVTKYLTWKELVHTTYFHIPRFRKLVAYAVAQADGFKASDTFLADPDYNLVAGWYEEIATPRSVDQRNEGAGA